MHRYIRVQNSSPTYKSVTRTGKGALYRDLYRRYIGAITLNRCPRRREQRLVPPADLPHHPVTAHSLPPARCHAVTHGEVHDLRPDEKGNLNGQTTGG